MSQPNEPRPEQRKATLSPRLDSMKPVSRAGGAAHYPEPFLCSELAGRKHPDQRMNPDDLQVQAFLYAADLLDEEETRQFEDLLGESQTAREVLASAVQQLHQASASEAMPTGEYRDVLVARLADETHPPAQQRSETQWTNDFRGQEPSGRRKPPRNRSLLLRRVRNIGGPLVLAAVLLLSASLTIWCPRCVPNHDLPPAEGPREARVAPTKQNNSKPPIPALMRNVDQAAKSKDQETASIRPSLEQLGEWLRLPRSRSIHDAHAEEQDRRKQQLLEFRLRGGHDPARPSLIYTSDPMDGVN